VTNNETHQKLQFSPPLASPSLIILSGLLAASTPVTSWLQSGVRGVDHCVETLSSLTSTDEVDQYMIRGLKDLVTGLLKTRENEGDAEARFSCQLGITEAMMFLHRKVWCGASHGIGHMLGPLGNVAHGETSCVLLPAVCKFNAKHGGKDILERQRLIRETLWDIPVARERFETKGLDEKNADLGDLIDALVRELGLKRSLSEVGVGREKFDILAANSMRDPFMTTNAVPILKKEQVMEILELCA